MDLAIAKAANTNTSPMLSHINVGVGEDVTIRELAEIIGQIVGYTGRIEFDSDKPDGAPRKLLQSDRLSGLGWAPRISLLEGLKSTYLSFLSEYEQPETTGVNL